MTARYYSSANEEALDEAQTAVDTLLDFFYNRSGQFSIDGRTANRCAAMIREVGDLLNQVQIVSEAVERTRRVEHVWQ